MTRKPPTRLYGLPGAERLHDDPATVWEHDIEPWIDEHDDRLPGAGVVEEWTVHPARSHLPSAGWLIDAITEWGSDDLLADEDPYPHAHAAANVALADQLLDAIAADASWHQANELVATHIISIVDGEPHLDGKPLYRPRPLELTR